MIYFCTQTNRRALVLAQQALNGIDYLEVGETDGGPSQRLLITLLHDARQADLRSEQIQISGEPTAAQVSVVAISPATDTAPRTVTAELDRPGDFSAYTLSLVAAPSVSDPPDGFDPALSSVSFSFKAGCPTVGDCLPDNCCPPEVRLEPDINYLAKDYEGFRQVMLDRLAVLVPGWAETHAADMGIALVEVLAYAADHLSYQQDSAGTEAYLGTARSRISLRRHARLVDYRLDEGSNARTWVYVKASEGKVFVPQGDGDAATGTLFLPRLAGFPSAVRPGTGLADELMGKSVIAFAPMRDSWLYQEQNEMSFYTWGDADCCLPPGATAATLAGNLTSLQAGTVVLFEEVAGPNTGDAADADPAKRWVVRLAGAEHADYLGRPLADPLNGQPITRIRWDPGDALPFPLCISSTTDEEHGSHPLADVSVARGNLIPADHGLWQDWEDLGPVPAAAAAPVVEASCQCGVDNPAQPPRPRYSPRLEDAPLTFARAYDPSAPASAFLAGPDGPLRAVPQLCVQDDRGQGWSVLDDLLSSDGAKRVFVVEIEHDGTASLRFGDGEYGTSPETGTSFRARYRVGSGRMGNMGRDIIGHALTDASGIVEVRNPLPTAGGVDPETMEHIRQTAPWAFRTQMRAVTEDDYGTMAQSDAAIHEAHGTLRWTGSWYTAFISIDPADGSEPAATLARSTKERMNLLRMAGVDLEVEGAVIVGLRIEMNICVDPRHFRSTVQAAVLQLFTTGDVCDGRRGLLNPQNFTFGQTIYTSPFVAAAQGVEGVTAATMTVFQRMDDPSTDGAEQGYLTMGRLEIARCDNDPGRLDHGSFVLHMDGGK